MMRASFAAFVLMSLVVAPAIVRADDPGNEAFAKAEAHFKASEWEEALAALQGFLLDHPKHPRVAEGRYYAGVCLAETDEPEQAIDQLDTFLREHAASPIAEKALPKLGELYRDQEQYERAKEVWSGFLSKYANSEDRFRVFDMLIDLAIQNKKDFETGFRECVRWVKENAMPEQTEHARFMGAYCLIMLHREKDAKAWIDTHLPAGEAHESGFRSVLEIAGKLAEHHDDDALRAVDGFFDLYADISDWDERSDLREKLCLVLRVSSKFEKARVLIVNELKQITARTEEQVTGLFDSLNEIIDEADDLDWTTNLTELSGPAFPLLTRAIAIEKLVDNLKEDEDRDKAESILRRLVADDSSPFIRVRSALKLASFLAEEREDRHAAVRVLKDLIPKTNRPDLLTKLHEAIKEYDDGNGTN